MNDIHIRPFAEEDQEAAHSLILVGLGDHFDVLDPALNPDLDNIWENYITRGGRFLVAVCNCELVGTGALLKETINTGRIVRMSVSSSMRRRGIGRRLTEALIDIARQTGYERVVVETNDDWHEAIRLYKSCGFRPYDLRDGEIHLQLILHGRP